MTIEDQIKDGKLQYNINREAAKMSAYHQVKLISMNVLLVKKYCHLNECLTGEEILPSN